MKEAGKAGKAGTAGFLAKDLQADAPRRNNYDEKLNMQSTSVVYQGNTGFDCYKRFCIIVLSLDCSDAPERVNVILSGNFFVTGIRFVFTFNTPFPKHPATTIYFFLYDNSLLITNNSPNFDTFWTYPIQAPFPQRLSSPAFAAARLQPDCTLLAHTQRLQHGPKDSP